MVSSLPRSGSSIWRRSAPLTPEAVDLGLGGLERVELQWGFKDAALVTRRPCRGPSPRRGLLALLDQPTFDINALPPLPANLAGLFVLSLDLAKTYDQIDALMKRVNPPSPSDPPGAGILARHGIDLRKELFGHIGPQFVFLRTAPRADKSANRGLPVDVASRRLHRGRASPRRSRGVPGDRFSDQIVQPNVESVSARDSTRDGPCSVPGVSEVPEVAWSPILRTCWTCLLTHFLSRT